MKTKLEILEETVAFYSEDTSRRAIMDGTCRYLTDDGKRCAYGRCLIPEKYTPKWENKSCYAIHNDENLQEEYRGHSISFWEHIQSLHDNLNYWNNEGLTKSGVYRVHEIKEYITSGHYD